MKVSPDFVTDLECRTTKKAGSLYTESLKFAYSRLLLVVLFSLVMHWLVGNDVEYLVEAYATSRMVADSMHDEVRTTFQLS
jgi:hypothetical protein